MKNQKNNPTFSLSQDHVDYLWWATNQYITDVVDRPIKRHQFDEDDLDWSKITEKMWQLFITEEDYWIRDFCRKDGINKEVLLDAFRNLLTSPEFAEDLKLRWKERLCVMICREKLPIEISYTFKKV